jgi:hypothetical protein
LGFPGGGEAKIVRAIKFVLYKIDKLVIVISLALSSKSIGTSLKTQTFFSYSAKEEIALYTKRAENKIDIFFVLVYT